MRKERVGPTVKWWRDPTASPENLNVVVIYFFFLSKNLYVNYSFQNKFSNQIYFNN